MSKSLQTKWSGGYGRAFERFPQLCSLYNWFYALFLQSNLEKLISRSRIYVVYRDKIYTLYVNF